MGIDVHFTSEDWRRLERDWSAWWAGELERPMVVMDYLDPKVDEALPPAYRFTSYFGLEMPADEVLDRYQARLEARRWWGDAWPKWWPNFGPGIMAGFLGCKVNAVEETTWFDPARITKIEDIHPRYDTDNPWWRRAQDLTRRAIERWGDRVAVAFTDLGGNLDVLASLRSTEQLLYDVYDSPEEVERLVGDITRLWLRYYDEQHALISRTGRGTTPWAPIWSPERCYMLQCDFSYMISPKMFERFVLPDLAACCAHMEHAFYHLDGKGEIAHLDMLLALEDLRGVQWIPGDGAPPADQWLPLLKRIRDGGKLCQVFVTPEGALRIVRELGGKGFVLQISEQMPEAEAKGFLELLAKEDKSRSR